MSVILACEASLLRQALLEAKKANLNAMWPDYMQLTPPENGVAILREGSMCWRVGQTAQGSDYRKLSQMPRSVEKPSTMPLQPAFQMRMRVLQRVASGQICRSASC